MSCLAGINAPRDSCFVLEDSLGFERDPVSTKGAVTRVVYNRNSRRQLLKFLSERALGLGSEIGQLFIRYGKQSMSFPFIKAKLYGSLGMCVLRDLNEMLALSVIT